MARELSIPTYYCAYTISLGGGPIGIVVLTKILISNLVQVVIGPSVRQSSCSQPFYFLFRPISCHNSVDTLKSRGFHLRPCMAGSIVRVNRFAGPCRSQCMRPKNRSASPGLNRVLPRNDINERYEHVVITTAGNME